MTAYAQVTEALHGQGWSTVEDVAARAGLPVRTVDLALTLLVDAGEAFVQVDAARDPDGAVLVFTDEP